MTVLFVVFTIIGCIAMMVIPLIFVIPPLIGIPIYCAYAVGVMMLGHFAVHQNDK
jgi:fatty acid desaturase